MKQKAIEVQVDEQVLKDAIEGKDTSSVEELQSEQEEMLDDAQYCSGEDCPFKRCGGCEFLNEIIKSSKDYKKVHKSRFTALLSYVIIIVLIVCVFYILGVTFFPEQTKQTTDSVVTWFTGDDGLKSVISNAITTIKEEFTKLSGGNGNTSTQGASIGLY